MVIQELIQAMSAPALQGGASLVDQTSMHARADSSNKFLKSDPNSLDLSTTEDSHLLSSTQCCSVEKNVFLII